MEDIVFRKGKFTDRDLWTHWLRRAVSTFFADINKDFVQGLEDFFPCINIRSVYQTFMIITGTVMFPKLQALY
jgi:hypothetical protein